MSEPSFVLHVLNRGGKVITYILIHQSLHTSIFISNEGLVVIVLLVLVVALTKAILGRDLANALYGIQLTWLTFLVLPR